MAVFPQPNLTASAELTGSLRDYPAVLVPNSPDQVYLRRFAVFDSDSATRVPAQIRNDYGISFRRPVSPVEYSEGNIKKSTQPIGVAGYNHRAMPMFSPDDLSQEEMMMYLGQTEPKNRETLRMAMSLNQNQNFLRTPTVNADYPYQTHNMMNNLLSLAAAKKAAV